MPIQTASGEPSIRVLLALLAVLAVAQAAAGQTSKVVFHGGPDESGHVYVYTVENLHSSPIVSVRFPHFNADSFTVPTGWSTDGTTNLIGRERSDDAGFCIGTAPSADQGIRNGQPLGFSMRIAPAGAHRGTGTVRVEFADGTVAMVKDVPVPVPEPALPRYARLLGFGVLFLMFLVWRAASRRKAARAGDVPDSVTDHST